MGTEPQGLNYFNYFTETEEHFQRARGTSLFLMSPLDWALVESWQLSGVPLEAVLRGIDAAFEKWRSRKVKTQMVNSLAFCAQAVLTEAQIMAGAACIAEGHAGSAQEIRDWMSGNLCRCGAYDHIVAAIQDAARAGSGRGG